MSPTASERYAEHAPATSPFMTIGLGFLTFSCSPIRLTEAEYSLSYLIRLESLFIGYLYPLYYLKYYFEYLFIADSISPESISSAELRISGNLSSIFRISSAGNLPSTHLARS